MILKTCMMTQSTCYKQTNRGLKHIGIVVHSTGANNPYLNRYVQPSEDDPERPFILQDLGKNKYGNDWNHKDRQAGVHAFIGKNQYGVVETYQVMPYDFAAWGVGKGKHGSYNFAPLSHIQFEICEDDLKDEGYFYTVMREAQEYCAKLCYLYKFDPHKAICSHAEAAKLGYASSHGDPDHWLEKYGKSMDWFREEVETMLYTDYPYVCYDPNDKIVGFFATVEEANSKIGCRVVYRGTSIQIPMSIPEDEILEIISEEENEDGLMEDTSSEKSNWLMTVILAVIQVFLKLFKGGSNNEDD